MGSPVPNQPAASRRELRRHGSYFDVDAEGFLVKRLSIASLQDGWKDAVDDVVRACVRQFGGLLHSVYARGSVAKGLAIDHVSDVDCMVAVTTGRPIAGFTAIWPPNLWRSLKQRYPFAARFDVMVGSAEQARVNRDVQVMLLTQALCVHGSDLSSEFPRLRPGREACCMFKELHSHIDACLVSIETRSPEQVQNLCVWIMRNVLRASFELVMERERRYTRDLYLCYESFAKYYPDRAEEMYHILDLAVNPSSDRHRIANALRRLDWLHEEIALTVGEGD